MDEFKRVFDVTGYPLSMITWFAVTGGRSRGLTDDFYGVPIIKVPEIKAIGRGGLFLAGEERALVVSAGSGTAMITAKDKSYDHVTGSAVGGGTLQGLGKLLLNTVDPLQLDAMALQGDANKADITLKEATGGQLGKLPADANAVNFGRSARVNGVEITPNDIAAGLVRMVGQVISVIAINAAKAERLNKIIFIGHLLDMVSVQEVLKSVARYYGAKFIFPHSPGLGTAYGALLEAEDYFRT